MVTKASGDPEVFSFDKLERSLRNAGASQQNINHILAEIERWIFHGITTKMIYRKAFSLLQKQHLPSSIRYKLKSAILELGPSGYPFERFIGQLMKARGFSTQVGIVVDGSCVTHEMDVIATKDQTQLLMECKYSKDQGKHVSVQVPLYVRSRVNDIVQLRKSQPQFQNLNFEAWVVTNTRFSPDSIQYGTCSGLHLLGWDYPAGNGLKEMIEQLHIYPITVLSQLSMAEKQWLLEKEVVSCSQLLEQKEWLDALPLNPRKKKAILRELAELNSTR
jgi:hypothetical protein